MSELNPEQERAVRHRTGPMLVVACAGTGKTRVATLRIAELIRSGVHPAAILGVTFTNKAAQEMKERVEHLVGKSVLISTFHSLGARILRESIHHLGYTKDFVIYDEDDSEKLIKECARELGLPTKIELKGIRSEISRHKNNLTDPPKGDELLSSMFERYHEKLKSCNALDFDDLLFRTVMLLRQVPECLEQYRARWQYISVDEYQDTNSAQYVFVQLLAGRACNLFVVGDPDQSIYSWRGANIRNILDFERDFPGAQVVRLEQNYRSTNTILQAANHVIQYNGQRLEKKLWSALGEGDKISLFAASSERDEAAFIAKEIQGLVQSNVASYQEIAIFYRTNFQSRVFEDEFLSRRIPYTIIGGISFYQRKEIRDVLSFLRLLDNPRDLMAFSRVINLPKRGIGDTTLEKIIEAHAATGMAILDYLVEMYTNNAYANVPFTLTSRQKEGLADFAKTMLLLKETRNNGTLEELVHAAIHRTRYLEVLDQDTPTKQERLENLEELIVKAGEWDRERGEQDEKETRLSHFLEELSLAGSADRQTGVTASVSLMTMHNGKGLEYRVAFLPGLEEDLFPHINCKKNPEQIEEERRLFYVGITRAKERLYLSFAQKRSLWGQTRFMRKSRFLQEIPDKLVKKATYCRMQQAPSNPTACEPATKEPFKTDDVVFHAQFGIGKITGVQSGSMGLMYDVYFTKDCTTKRLVAAYAPLTALQGAGIKSAIAL